MIACSYKQDTFDPAEEVMFPFHYLLIAPHLAQGKWSHADSLCWVTLAPQPPPRVWFHIQKGSKENGALSPHN